MANSFTLIANITLPSAVCFTMEKVMQLHQLLPRNLLVCVPIAHRPMPLCLSCAPLRILGHGKAQVNVSVLHSFSLRT